MGILQNLTGWHALIVLAVIVLLFGATKLPSLARSVGESMRIFRDESRSDVSRRDVSRSDVTVSPPVDGNLESATAGTSPAADPVAVPSARSA